jgi:hypothetical protein
MKARLHTATYINRHEQDIASLFAVHLQVVYGGCNCKITLSYPNCVLVASGKDA